MVGWPSSGGSSGSTVTQPEEAPITAIPAGRADARRNRERLVAAAVTAFSDGAEPTLEAIARSAGVGIGTLYRHFPSREALVEEVYRTQLEQLCATADRLLARHDPLVALRRWLTRYADFVIAKRGMAEALRAVVASGAVTSAQTRARLTAAISTMLEAGVAEGSIRSDVRAEDVCAAMVGTVLVAGHADQRAQAARLLDLIVAGVAAASRS